MHDVLLDPSIRDWALIPIVLVTLLLQVFRHYISVWMQNENISSPEFMKESTTVKRSAYTRVNRGWIPSQSFEERRTEFSGTKGLLLAKPTSDESNAMGMMSDPTQMRGMMVGQVLTIGPHLSMMTFVQHFFPSFVVAKLPFPLTSRFRGMLQRGIEHPTLDVTYITAFCGYFLIMFGIRGIITLVLGDTSGKGFDEMEQLKNMSEGSMAGGPKQPQGNMNVPELENWSEALTVHEFFLNESERKLLAISPEL